MADAFDFFLVHQLGHALLQRLLVDLIGQLVDDDGLALAPVNVLEMAARAHHHPATTGTVALFHAIDAINDAGRWKVGRRDDVHQVVNGGVRVLEQVQTGIHHFVQVVRRDVGGHAHGNAARAVDQQVGQAGGQHQGLFFAAVVVGAEVDRFFLDVGQHLVRDLRHADFGVPHGRSVVAVHRAKVALAIDQHVA